MGKRILQKDVKVTKKIWKWGILTKLFVTKLSERDFEQEGTEGTERNGDREF